MLSILFILVIPFAVLLADEEDEMFDDMEEPTDYFEDDDDVEPEDEDDEVVDSDMLQRGEDECVSILEDYMDQNPNIYEDESVEIDLDEKDTDSEYVYLFIKNEDDEVLDHYRVDRDSGEIQRYDYDIDEWYEVE